MDVSKRRPPPASARFALILAIAGLSLAGCGWSGSSKTVLLTSPSEPAIPPRIISAKIVDSYVQIRYEAPGTWEKMLLSVIEPESGLPPLTQALRPVKAKGVITMTEGRVNPGAKLKVFGSLIEPLGGKRVYLRNPVHLTAPG